MKYGKRWLALLLAGVTLFTCAAAEEPETPVQNAAAVITCSKNGTSLTLSDAARTVYGGSNLLLRVSGDGKAAVEPLHNSYFNTDNG